MRGRFAAGLGRALNISRVDLVEKDIILHQILLDLSRNEFFKRNFLLKGGSCLIKHYLGYYRFSEDVDFTWADQRVFQGKSGKKIRKLLSELISEIGKIFEGIAKSRGLDFRCAKNNRKYVELVGSGRILTFKIWYNSDILGRKSFIKVQVNFVDNLYFNPVEGELHNLLLLKTIDEKEMKFLYPDFYEEYSIPVTLRMYDIREIICEKIRSILTRRGVKARDFVDVYMIFKKKRIDPRELDEEIVGKIRLMLGLYKRFRENLLATRRLLASHKLFSWGSERELLLTEIDEKDFYTFVSTLSKFLGEIINKIETGEEQGDSSR
ncbi:MAG: nucleotidyl transferase AbiEii/AbiGii toxin family protein [Candidatus Hadarchaeales archaeon]